MRDATDERYQGRSVYVGDIHNHCGISYGHGSISDAYRNARLQLDFASVTGHAHWHDMPEGDDRIARVREYHETGFRRLADCWDHVQQVTADVHEDGRFVSLLSFEWHSMTYGDHCVYYRGDHGPILRSGSLPELRDELRRLTAGGLPALALPHHIGYQKGWRGVNWDTYTPEFAPVVEMMSMHGCGESDRAPRPYLHTMGPRDEGSTAYHGLERGHLFGFIGSTDHHSAHPGSHGYGRLAVWADSLTRQGIWDAVTARRTYALTGDRITLATGVNDALMGEVAPAARERRVWARAAGGDEIDYLEIVRNGEVVHRVRPRPVEEADFLGTVAFSVGWGQLGVPVEWDVRLTVHGGQLLGVEPRLRGEDIVAPAESEPDRFSFSDWGREGTHAVRLRTLTRGNPTVRTDATQGIALRVRGDRSTRIVAEANGVTAEHTLAELLAGPRTGYTGGFVSGAYQFHRAVPDSLSTVEAELVEERPGDRRDWYHVRVRQVNDEWAWSSPTWVAAG